MDLHSSLKSVIQSSSSNTYKSFSTYLDTPSVNKPTNLKYFANVQSQKGPLKEMVLYQNEDTRNQFMDNQNKTNKYHTTFMYQMKEFQYKFHEEEKKEISSSNRKCCILIIEKIGKAIRDIVDHQEEGNNGRFTMDYRPHCFVISPNKVFQSKSQLYEDIDSLTPYTSRETNNTVSEGKR